jgi:uncharacterized membrane protein
VEFTLRHYTSGFQRDYAAAMNPADSPSLLAPSSSPAATTSAPPDPRNRGSQPAFERLAALDWMRGLVMILMAVDHASQTWNAGRVNADSAYLVDLATGAPAWIPGTELDLAQFLTRWITHLCAPTFLFLSGTSLAMSLEKRRARGDSPAALDRHLLVRGLVLLGFEGLLSLLANQGVLILQVLFAIAASMLAMIPLRRLPTQALLALGLGWLVASELVLTTFFPLPTVGSAGASAAATPGLLAHLFFVPGYAAPVYVLYPMTHWLAMMLLGWALGRHLLERRPDLSGRLQTEKILLLAGMTGLLLAAFLRRANVYGNMGLLRDDASLVQWLHMSKYPPALVYSLLELGLMALFLVYFLRRERRQTRAPGRWNPLLVFGQTALFFYIVHFIVLGGSALALTGGMMQRGLPETFAAAAATLVLLYPVCLGYRALKRRHPNSILQYV